MQILHQNMDSRLPGEAIPYEDENRKKDYFLLVHPTDDIEAEIERLCCTETQNDHCKGILFVKGSPYGGLGLERAKELQDKYDPKVHFLSYAVAQRSDLPTGYEERFKEFFSKIENENPIDWELIDPIYPESIVAALLLLQACRHKGSKMSTINTTRINRAISRFQQLRPGRSHELRSEENAILKSAIKAYNSRSSQDEELQYELNWNNKGQVNALIDKLNTFLSAR